jgi:hypothetical protein
MSKLKRKLFESIDYDKMTDFRCAVNTPHSEKSRVNLCNNIRVKISNKFLRQIIFSFKVKGERKWQFISSKEVAHCCKGSLEPKQSWILKKSKNAE